MFREVYQRQEPPLQHRSCFSHESSLADRVNRGQVKVMNIKFVAGDQLSSVTPDQIVSNDRYHHPSHYPVHNQHYTAPSVNSPEPPASKRFRYDDHSIPSVPPPWMTPKSNVPTPRNVPEKSVSFVPAAELPFQFVAGKHDSVPGSADSGYATPPKPLRSFATKSDTQHVHFLSNFESANTEYSRIETPPRKQHCYATVSSPQVQFRPNFGPCDGEREPAPISITSHRDDELSSTYSIPLNERFKSIKQEYVTVKQEYGAIKQEYDSAPDPYDDFNNNSHSRSRILKDKFPEISLNECSFTEEDDCTVVRVISTPYRQVAAANLIKESPSPCVVDMKELRRRSLELERELNSQSYSITARQMGIKKKQIKRSLSARNPPSRRPWR